MRTKPNDARWLGFAFCTALCAAAIVLAIYGADKKGTDAALGATARVSFLFFWLAYAGSPLAALFGGVFQPVKARGREFGLAFASAHLVHVGLIVWLCAIGAVPSVSIFLFFGIALVWTYLLAFLSFADVQKLLKPPAARLLFTAGMNYIALAFAVDFMKNPLSGGIRHLVLYVPFVSLAVLGPALRLAVFIRRSGFHAQFLKRNPAGSLPADRQ